MRTGPSIRPVGVSFGRRSGEGVIRADGVKPGLRLQVAGLKVDNFCY